MPIVVVRVCMNRNKHDFIFWVPFTVLNVSEVNIIDENHHITNVHDQSGKMLVEGKGSPFVVDQISDEVSFEDGKLIASS